MQILHLSDLHFTLEDPAQNALLIGPLCADLEVVCEEYGRPDLLIFSGDLVNNPEEKNVYCSLLSPLDSIIASAGVPYERCVFLPGNHDVSRARQRGNPILYDGMQRQSRSMMDINSRYKQGHLNSYLHEINAHFFDFAHAFDQEWSDPLFRVFDFPAINLAIIAINTSMSCSLSGSAHDHGKLWFPTDALYKAITSVPPGRTIISAGHHPWSHFDEMASREIVPIIVKHSKIHYFGHVHDARPTIQTRPDSTFVEAQSGALYQGADWFKGYCLSSLAETGEMRFVYRTFFDARQCFDAGTNVCESGVFYPSLESRSYWQSGLRTFDKCKLGEWLSGEALPIITADLSRDALIEDLRLPGKSLLDVYVFPPLSRRPAVEKDGETLSMSQSLKLVAERDILDARQHVAVEFAPEYGATSFLKYLGIKFAQNARHSEQPIVPLYLDMKEMKHYSSALERALKAAHPEVDHPRFGWKALKEVQPYALLIDNFEEDNDEHVKVLESLGRIVPQARKVIVKRPNIAGGLSARPQGSPIDASFLDLILRPFGRNKIRAMVRSHEFLRKGGAESALTEEVDRMFGSLGLPATGPLISIYLILKSSFDKFAPVNVSTIVEALVALLLSAADKRGLRESSFFREQFDSAEQIEVLAFIAEKFAREQVDRIGYDELLARIAEYYKLVGIDRQPILIAHQFTSIGVLERSKNEVTFRYGLAYSYFLARRMMSDPAFKAHVLSPSVVPDFVQVIDIYCGLNRADIEALYRVAANFESVDQELRGFFGLAPILPIDQLKLPVVDDLDRFQSKLTQSLLREETTETADARLDTGTSEFRSQMRKPRVKPLAIRWFEGLRALSVAVKNLEGIQGAEKSKYAAMALNAWGAAFEAAVYVLGVGLRDGEVEVGEMSIKLEVGRKIDGRIMRILLTAIPGLVTDVAMTNLATPKLERQLKDLRGLIDQNGEFCRVGLIASMKLDGYLSEVRSYVDKMRGSRFLLEALMSYLRWLYLRYDTENGDSQIRREIAEIDATIRGLKGAARSEHIAKVLQSAARKKILAERQ